jgi:hypothetical protein
MAALRHILPDEQLAREKNVLEKTQGFEPTEMGVIYHTARVLIEDVARQNLQQTRAVAKTIDRELRRIMVDQEARLQKYEKKASVMPNTTTPTLDNAEARNHTVGHQDIEDTASELINGAAREAEQEFDDKEDMSDDNEENKAVEESDDDESEMAANDNESKETDVEDEDTVARQITTDMRLVGSSVKVPETFRVQCATQ